MSLSSSPLGRLFVLSLKTRQPLFRLGPIVAVIAGILSAGRLPEERWFLSLVLLCLIVDPLFGAAWSYGVDAGPWKALIHADIGEEGTRFAWLPYTQAHSLSRRTQQWLGKFLHWWNTRFSPEYGNAFLSFWLAGALALLLAWLVSPRLIMPASLAVVTIILIGIGSSAGVSSAGRMLIEFAFPWLLGGVAAGQMNAVWFLEFVIFCLMYFAGLRAADGRRKTLWLFVGSQAAAGLLLAAWQHYLFAAPAALFVILEWRLLHQAVAAGDENKGVAASQPLAVAVLLISSLGVSGLIK